jgi:hypothetical protein
MNNQRWQIWLSALLGLWVFLSPWIFVNADSTVAAPLTNGAEWNLWLVGAAVVLLSVVAALAYQAWEEWLTAALGAWLVASPWVFGFTDATAMTWSTIVAGVAIVLVSGWTALISPAGDDSFGRSSASR